MDSRRARRCLVALREQIKRQGQRTTDDESLTLHAVLLRCSAAFERCSNFRRRNPESSRTGRTWPLAADTEAHKAHASKIARPAAKRVPRKFTPSLLSHPRRSKVAPKKLSKIIPALPASSAIQNQRAGTTRVSTHTAATTTAAAIPATVPMIVTPPSVPVGTSLNVVIRRALPSRACPSSLDTVSAAASDNAAAVASTHTSLPVKAKATENAAAVDRLAKTWEAVRP